jgi:hypothetical protein
VPLEQRYISHDVNLRLKPIETYIYDEYKELAEVEDVLDEVQFFSELSFNINLKRFLKEKALS